MVTQAPFHHSRSCTATTSPQLIIIIPTISRSVCTSVHLLLLGISSRQRLEVVSSILLFVWHCNLPPVFWQSLIRADNAVTESVKASNGDHIQMYAKISILCEERTGCYCNTFDWCQTVGIGLDDSWVQWMPGWIPRQWIYRRRWLRKQWL